MDNIFNQHRRNVNPVDRALGITDFVLFVIAFMIIPVTLIYREGCMTVMRQKHEHLRVPKQSRELVPEELKRFSVLFAFFAVIIWLVIAAAGFARIGRARERGVGIRGAQIITLTQKLIFMTISGYLLFEIRPDLVNEYPEPIRKYAPLISIGFSWLVLLLPL